MTTCSKICETRCWDTLGISHWAHLKVRFFDQFMHFSSKIAAKIFPRVLAVAPPKSRYMRTFLRSTRYCNLFWLFLLGEISTCFRLFLSNQCSESLAVFCVSNMTLFTNRKQASKTWQVPNRVSQKVFRLHFLHYRNFITM